MSQDRYKRDEHRVHMVIYHLIWCPKRRKSVLTDNVAVDLRSIIEGKCDEQGWDIIELAIQPDHVHLFVQVWPTDSAADVVKHCKGLSARRLNEKYPERLKRLPSLWTRSYFVSTAGNVSKETIQRYIAAQK